MNNHTNLSCLRQSKRRQTSLALKAPRAFNLSKLGAPSCFRTLRFKRFGRSSAHINHNHNPNEQPRESALPSSIETKADLACVESTPCFQLEQARRSELLSRAKSQRSSRSSRPVLPVKAQINCI